MVGIWWLLFSIPLFLFVDEEKNDLNPNYKDLVKTSLLQIKKTFLSIKKSHNIFYFLIAYFFYIDGVNTIIKMAVDFGFAIGLKLNDLIFAILIVQFIGFPATMAMNNFVNKFGSKKTLYFCLSIYAFATLWAYFMSSSWEFYILAFCIAISQGATQSISRGVFAKLIPQDQGGEYFGFYNMLGKFSAVLGPLLVAIISLMTNSPQLSILSIFILFALGGFFLHKVKLT